jgi:hypothetical protein
MLTYAGRSLTSDEVVDLDVYWRMLTSRGLTTDEVVDLVVYWRLLPSRGLTSDEVVDLVERLVLNVYVVYTCDDVVYFHLY